MDILEIALKNPIGFNEIDQFGLELIETKHHDFLIIDTNEHNFENPAVIKYFRDQFDIWEERLSKFKKIAFIRPPQYINESTNPKVYEFFDSKKGAEKWFRE